MTQMLGDAARFFLHQLAALLAPAGFVWGALIVLAAVLWRRKQRGPALAAAALAGFITIIGSTSFPDRLLASLERPYAGGNPGDLPAADAVVLLGGGAQASRYEVAGVHLSAAGDRLVMAAELMRLGKAPLLLLGGAWGQLDGREMPESGITRELLTRWGVSPDAMIPLGNNGDTHDEALKVRDLAAARGVRRILLVTSANHMRRAAATFRHLGIEVTPAPCNFLTRVATDDPPFAIRIPGSEGFVKTGIWLHEEIGWLMYWRRGWLAPPKPGALQNK